MSTSVDFYTIPIMRDAVIDSATTDQDNAISNLLDFNLDTVWKPTSIASQTITIDTQSVDHASPMPSPIPLPVYGVDAIGIWLANNDVDFSVSTGSGLMVQALFSDDNGVTDPYSGTTIHNFEHNGGNLFLFTLTEQFARYWQIKFTGLDSTAYPEIGHIFLCKTRTLNARPKFPVKTERVHHNNSVNLTGGRRRVSSKAINPQYKYERNFTLINTTEEDTVRNIYDDSLGSLLPFIYQEQTNIEDAVVCRMSKETPDITEIDHEFFDCSMRFEQFPFILDGETL